MKKMTSFEGDTGVYLQYAHVRLASMERKNPNVVLPEDTSLVQTDLLAEDRAHDIVYLLALYPDVVRTAYNLSEPSTIVTFAFKLAHAISGAWDGRASLPSPRSAPFARAPLAARCMLTPFASPSPPVRVQGVEPELAQARLYLFLSARDVLGTALRLLTLTPLDRM